MKPKLHCSSLILSLILCSPFHLWAENLILNGNAELGSTEHFSASGCDFTATKESAYEGEYGFEVIKTEESEARDIVNSDLIEISPDKTYELSVMLKSAGNTLSSDVYVGIMSFDQDQALFYSHAINFRLNTETELVEDANVGDDVVKIKNIDRWLTPDPLGYIAFNAEADFSDLPNRDLSPLGIKSATKQGDHWAITLELPLTKFFPAGTKVRQHIHGNTYNYFVVGGTTIPLEWTMFRKQISGIERGQLNTNFWPGTRYVKLLILSGTNPNERLLVDDISFEEVP